ncbi:MAG: ATP-grasp domain-containing protein [Gemmataceae bacterium]
MPTLILTPRYTEDSQALWRAAGKLGWGVERLTNWRVPEELLTVSNPVLYLEALFGPTLARQFGLRLLEPSIDWLPRLPEEFRKRRVGLMPFRAAKQLAEPAFIKPPNDKSFPAQVYTGAELPDGYDEDLPVLVSEIVSWEVEFRCFVLDRQPQAMSVYLRNGVLQREQGFVASDAEFAEADRFVRTVLADDRVDFPRATVLDVGVIVGRGWAVVEQNTAWGSGIYGCDPVRVLQVIQHAAVPDAEPYVVAGSGRMI